jgi:hypothetical protein
MKKIILSIAVALFLSSCGDGTEKTFTGYVVHKEYLAGHMCHSEFKEIQESSVVVIVPHVVHKHHHSYKHPEYNLFVANRYDVRFFAVDSTTWLKQRLGHKVSFKD